MTNTYKAVSREMANIYKAVAKEMRRLVGRRAPMPGKIIAHNFISDTTEWHTDKIDKLGGTITSQQTVVGVGSWTTPVRKIEYDIQGAHRVMLLVGHQGDIDSFAEESLVYAKGDEPTTADEIADEFEAAKKAEADAHKSVMDRLEELDELVPVGSAQFL